MDVLVKSKRGCSFRAGTFTAGFSLRVGDNMVPEDVVDAAMADPDTADWFGPAGFIEVERPAPAVPPVVAKVTVTQAPSADDVLDSVQRAPLPPRRFDPEGPLPRRKGK